MDDDKGIHPTQDEEESMYKSFIEESQQGVMIFQGNPPRIVYANPAITKISGFSNIEILSFTLEELQEITHPEDRELVFRDLYYYTSGNFEPQQYTFRAQRKNGATYWAELTASLIIHKGAPAILVGLLDVSEIKNAEQKIAEERDRAQLYLDWAGVMFLALDPDGSIVLLNRKACEILECDMAEAIGEDWFDTFIPERVRSDTRGIFNRLMKGEVLSLRERENSIVTKKGTEKLMSWYTTILRDKNDVIVGLLSSGVDITEQRRAEEEKAESEKKYRNLVEQLPVVTWTSDKDGNTIYISPNVEEIYGYSSQEIMEGGNDLWFGRIHPDDRVRVQKEHEMSIDEKRGFDITYRIRRKDGEWIWIHDTATKVYEQDEVSYSSGMFTDVTDRKEMELALKESERKYRSLVENMQDGIAILQSGIIVFANNALAKMLGYSANEIEGKDFVSLISPEDRGLVAERYSKRIAGEEVPRGYDISAIHKNGSKRILRLQADSIEYEGKPAIVSTIVDITDRKTMEIALEESEEKYRTLVENMQDGVAIIQDGNLVFTNSMLSKILGYASEELADRPFLNLIAPEDKAFVAERYQKELSGKGITQDIDIRAIKKDGSLPYLRLNGVFMEYQGRPAVLATVTDITERKEFEDRLRIVEYSIDKASDPVLWMDKDGKFIFTNEATLKYLGFSKREIEDLTVWDIFPEFGTELGPKLLASLKDKGSDLIEIAIKDKEGNLHPVEVNASYLIFEGRELFFTYVRDISDRKAAEIALQKSADELRATKDRALLYLDIMGHDIRNKLQGMMLATQLVLLDINQEDVQEAIDVQEKTIETIQSLITRVKSLEEMINEALAERDFVTEIKESINALRNKHPHVEIDVDIRMKKAIVFADSFMETLVSNILDNAVQHNPSTTPKIWVIFDEQSGGYNLSISDNGPGISDSRKAELLDPNRRYGGIALHQSKFIVEKYGGRINILDRIEGSPTEGARFCVWIPSL